MTTAAAPITSATPAAPTSSTWVRGKLRKLFIAPVSSAVRTTRIGFLAPHLASAWAAVLVEGVSKLEASRTATESRSAWTESAERIARRRALRLTLTVYLRGFGPKVTPPPKRLETPSVPTRARPVPFWRQALAVVKETSPRVRVEAVPRRRDAEVGAGGLVDQRLVEGLGEELFRQVGFGRSCRARWL